MGTPLMTPLDIVPPVLEYGLLMPFILIFAAACLGVLVEALVPRPSRLSAQLVVTFVAIIAALALVIRNWRGAGDHITAVGSVAIDGPTYFTWALLLVFGAVSFLLFADRTLENGSSAFAPQASAVPGTAAEQEAITAGVEHTEVFPLALFALSGMMLFPASADLITMFIALEI